MQVTSLVEQLLFTTVRITTHGAAGDGLGTGFLYTDPTPDGQSTRLFLVTNKHVIDGVDSAEFHLIAALNGSPALGQERVVGITNLSGQFRGHPDPAIDIAMMPFAGIVNGLNSRGQDIFYRGISHDLCADNARLADFEPIEPVTFIGYPNGLYDTASFLPIVRRGHSATPLTVDYQGKPTFLIDASVFPGSSGSPVFLYVPPSAPDKFGNIVIGGGAKLLFLGVVAAVYQRNVPVLTASAGQYVNELLDIGIVYKASAVSELARTF